MGGSETEAEDNQSEEDEEEEEEETQNSEISEYEKKRLERIEENKARLKALGLPALASPLVATEAKNKKKKKKKKRTKRKLYHHGDKETDDDDDEYRPSDDEGEAEEEDREISSDTEEEEEDICAIAPSPSSSRSRQRKEGKKKSTSHAAKIGKRLHGKQLIKESDDIDHDTALQQAIALSLGGATEQTGNDGVSRNCGTNGAGSSSCVKKDRANLQETSGRKNSRKVNKSRVQLTEDEVIAFFFSFDVAGKGHITTRDLHRMVIAHDFTWTEMEMEHMIHCFDDDKDGRLTLEDFRSIIIRCNMLQEPGKC